MRGVTMFVALAAAASLILAAGAATGGAATGRALSTESVIQTGMKNYAGPNCPGPEWNCTASMQVVQITAAGGVNRFECTPAAAGTDANTNTCVVNQAGTKNQATCKLEDSDEPLSAQTCDITQNGVQNSANVSMLIQQLVGPEQEARQIAKVDQTASQSNSSSVVQTVTQRTKVGTSQTQDAFQVADVDQTANGSANTSHVDQTQTQRAEGTAGTQDQNTKPIPDVVFDCGFEKPANPNQCANVEQVTPNGGDNDSELHQTINETQLTSAVATQTQGSLDGGQEGDVHQENPPGEGHNSDDAHQVLTQLQSAAPGATQTQLTDPGCCGFGSQVGGAKDGENIDQTVTQTASEDEASQFSGFLGQAHQTPEEGEEFAVQPSQIETTEGKCMIDQHGRNNSGDGHFTLSGQDEECASLVLESECASGPIADELEAQEGCVQTFPPPPCEICVEGGVAGGPVTTLRRG